MKSVRIVCLAALTAAVAMALVGASSATATSLCKVKEDPCAAKNLVTNLHLVESAGSVEKLSNSTANILCLNVLQEAEVGEAGGELQEITVTNLTFSGCGTNASHNNCTVKAEGEAPVSWHIRLHFFLLLLLLGLDGVMAVECTILGFVKIDCLYDEGSIEGAMVEDALESEGSGHGMITFNKTPLEVAGGELCPKETAITGLLEPLEHVYAAE